MKIELLIKILVTGIVLSACTTHHSSKNTSPLFDKFSEYQNSKNRNVNSEIFFSKNLWNALEKTRKLSDKEHDLNNTLLQFPSHIVNISSHKESITNGDGCLMVMGVDKDNTPIDYYISFITENETWVFNDIQVKYFFDGTKRFLKEAVCDADKQNQLWVEFMQSQH